MAEEEFYQSLTKPLALSFDRFEIKDVLVKEVPGKDVPKAGETLVAPAPSGPGRGYTRRGANERLNGRLAASLPVASEWRVQWKTPLSEHLTPKLLLQLDERLVLQSGSSVCLFDAANGSHVQEYDLGPSDVAIDPVSGTFHFADSTAYIQACRLDGHLEHVCPVRFTLDFSHILVWRYPDGYLVFSRSAGWPMTTFPKVWAAERVELGDPTRMDEGRLLEATRSAGTLLQRKNKLLPPPTDGRWFWLATHDRLYALAQDLQVARALTGELDPLAISLDESGRIYLVVREGELAAFWLLTQDGERLLKAPLPASVSRPVAPPLIDHLHRSVILGEDSLVVVASGGGIVWQRSFDGLEGTGIQASITGDDQLLVAAGPRIAAFTGEGQPAILYQDGQEQFVTAPVLDEKGRLFIASRRSLYCLRPVTARR